jgi:hypothetical protein
MVDVDEGVATNVVGSGTGVATTGVAVDSGNDVATGAADVVAVEAGNWVDSVTTAMDASTDVLVVEAVGRAFHGAEQPTSITSDRLMATIFSLAATPHQIG